MSTASRKPARGKPSRWEKLNGDRRVREYQWEFLRRNEGYQRDYAAFSNRFADWLEKYGYWGWRPLQYVMEQEPEARSVFETQVEPTAWKIIEHWNISDLYDPEGVHSPFFPKRHPISVVTGGKHVDGYEDESESLEPPVRDYFSSELGDAPHTDRGLRFIQVEIDISEPLDRIFEHLEVPILEARARYRAHIGPIAEFRKQSRARMDQYETYLKVWDLRKQDLTFEEIAFRLFPLEMKNPAFWSTGTKRVRSQFQRAKELIEGGYRQIEG